MKPLGPLMASPTSSAALGRTAPDASSPSAAVSVICAPALCSGEEGALARMLPAFKLGLGGPNRQRQTVDVVDSYRRYGGDYSPLYQQSRNSRRGQCHGTPPGYQSRVFGAALAAALQRPDFLAMPAFMVKILFGEMGEELLLQGQKVDSCKNPRCGL